MRHIALLLVVACGPNHVGHDANLGGGDGQATDGTSSDAGSCNQLTAVFRDFRMDHPDFEHRTGDDRNILNGVLGIDGRPVYALAGASNTVSGPTTFAQWY